MTQVNKNDVNQIFASNAPDQDKPPSFNNYTNGWGESRTNNGKPTIKQLNFTQQRTDQNLLWIHQNGGALPYDSSIEYADGVIVLKEGRLSKLVDGSWIDVLKSENEKALPPYYSSNVVYVTGSRIMLDDNSGFVVSIIDNNANNPNSNMTGWSKAEKIENVSTISDMKLYSDTSVSFLTVNRYAPNADVRSGGRFYYDSTDTSTAEDGVFVFTSSVLSGRWKRVLDNNKINILQGGLVGTGDESDLLNNLLTACANQSTVLNLSRKFIVDGLQMHVNTTKQINLNMTLVDLTNIDIDSSIPTQGKYNIETGCALLVYGIDAWTNNPTTYRRRGREKLKGVFVSNVGTGTNVLGMYLKPDATGQFDSSRFDQCFVTGFDYNLILSSNCYLISFYNCKFNGAKKSILTTSSYLGIESSMQNMGENIRFIACNLSDANKVLTLDYQMWLNCYGCSFDYVGKSTDITGWFELLGQVTLNLTDCHYEAGNQNSQLGKKMFYTNNKFSAVNIKGGTMVFGFENDNDYVFYSDEPLNQNFTVEGVWVFGAGLAKKAWSNTGMGRFRITTNTGFDMQDVNAFGVQAPNKTLTKDYNFVKSNLLQKSIDQWYVSSGGDTTRTSPISSSGVTGSYTTTTDENGNTVPCLKLVVNKTEQSVSLLIKRPTLRNSFNPAFRLRYKANTSIGGNLYASIKPVDVYQEIDVRNSVFVPTINGDRWNTSQFGFNIEQTASTSVQEMRLHNCAVRTFSGLETYDYYLFNINFTLRAGFELYILSAECYDMDN